MTFDNQQNQQNQQPSYGAVPGMPPAYAAPNAPGTPLSGVLKRNPLGLASLVVGAIGILGSFLYAALQISFIRAGNMDVLGALGTTSTVLTALFGIAAVILGVVALLRRPVSKAFASAGLALGGALLVETANALVYQIANSVL